MEGSSAKRHIMVTSKMLYCAEHHGGRGYVGVSQERQETHGSGSDTGHFRVQTWALAFPTSTVSLLSPAQQLKKEVM